MLAELKSWVVGDDNKPMYKSRGIIFIALAGISYAVYSALSISASLSHLQQCIPFHSTDCLDNLMVNMKYPITILTATLTLTGFWALLFRSHQTTKQINLTTKQIDLTISHNTFNNFLSHKKAFIEMLKEIEIQFQCQVLHKTNLYDSLFFENSPTHINFNGCKERFEILESDYKSVLSGFESYAFNIIRKDPMVDPDIRLTDIDESEFEYIHLRMKGLIKQIESLGIKGTEFIDVKYPEKLIDGNINICNDKAPKNLCKTLDTFGRLLEELAKFSNIEHSPLTILTPHDTLKAIRIYDDYVTLINNSNLS